MRTYYSEYPTGEFSAPSDDEALRMTKAQVVYKESDSRDGRPFVFIRDLRSQKVIKDNS